MKQMPTIQKFMTPMPKTIEFDALITEGKFMMREYNIRHLPVLNAGVLVGILTDRDIKLATSYADPLKLSVADVMTPEPYTVTPETPLARVVSEMSEKKYGCAVIQQENAKIVGVFTAVDGLRVLADTLYAFYKTTADEMSSHHSKKMDI